MKIAYLVLTHRYPEQVIRLILRLNTENALFLVHVDKKTNNKIYQQIFSSLSHLPNVYFLNRQSVYWGDFGMVAAALEGIKELFNKHIFFDWLVFLSGQDYPVKSTCQIEEFLSRNKGKLFIEYKNLMVTPPDESWPTSGFDRINYWHFHLHNMRFVFPAKLTTNAYNRYCRANQTWFRIFSFLWSGLIFWFPLKRKFPEGFKPFWGSNYWCLSRDCVEYIHSFVKQNKAFVNYFKYVELPEEMFFQTIILNSKFKENVINDNLFYIDWENPNPTRPRIFVKSDFERLVESFKLFARKFDCIKDTDILDLLDQEVLTDNKICVNKLQA
jgi:hypothetical protein